MGSDCLSDPQKNSSITCASSWDAVQIHFKCCGIESHQDWTNRSDTFKFYSLGKVTDRNITDYDEYRVPKSCCKKCEDGNCDEACGYGKNREIYESGCLDEVEHSLEENLAKLAGAAVGISVFEIITIILTFLLVRSLAKKEEFYKNLA